jgi:hypothetical protein
MTIRVVLAPDVVADAIQHLHDVLGPGELSPVDFFVFEADGYWLGEKFATRHSSMKATESLPIMSHNRTYLMARCAPARRIEHNFRVARHSAKGGRLSQNALVVWRELLVADLRAEFFRANRRLWMVCTSRLYP